MLPVWFYCGTQAEMKAAPLAESSGRLAALSSITRWFYTLCNVGGYDDDFPFLP